MNALRSHDMLSVFAPTGDRNALHGCVCYLGFAVLPAKSATANVLSPADYENFRNLDLKMLTIGDDLYGLITNRPATQAPDCVMNWRLSSMQCKPIFIA